MKHTQGRRQKNFHEGATEKITKNSKKTSKNSKKKPKNSTIKPMSTIYVPYV